jgi:hypothetical protein
MAYIISWEHAEKLLVASLIVGAATAFDYIGYAIENSAGKQKSL